MVVTNHGVPVEVPLLPGLADSLDVGKLSLPPIHFFLRAFGSRGWTGDLSR